MLKILLNIPNLNIKFRNLYLKPLLNKYYTTHLLGKKIVQYLQLYIPGFIKLS